MIAPKPNPEKVQTWLSSLAYNTTETMRTLPGVLRYKKAHCLEGALSAAVLLESQDYPPLILDLESADLLDHTLFLYKKNRKYGAIGKSRDVGLDGRKPVFKTIKALVQSYAVPYIDHHAEITGYGVLDLRTLKNTSWRTSKGNVWYVEEELRNIPHKKFTLPKKTIRYWRNKYRVYKKNFPNQQPQYFPDQKNWL